MKMCFRLMHFSTFHYALKLGVACRSMLTSLFCIPLAVCSMWEVQSAQQQPPPPWEEVLLFNRKWPCPTFLERVLALFLPSLPAFGSSRSFTPCILRSAQCALHGILENQLLSPCKGGQNKCRVHFSIYQQMQSHRAAVETRPKDSC